MKKKISLDHIDHNNAKRMEFFLNALDDELEEMPFHWEEMKMAEGMSGACRFMSTANPIPIIITTCFCNSYADATEIAKANQFPTTSKARWSINGDLLFLIETEDEEKLNEILSFFSGRE